jgi:hypothetical protein
VLGCLVHFASAQSADPAPVAPPLLPPVVAPAASLAEPGTMNLLTGDAANSFHLTGDVGVGIWSIHGGGPSNLVGTNGSVNLVGQRFGAGVSWWEASQTINRPGGWNFSHRP